MRIICLLLQHFFPVPELQQHGVLLIGQVHKVRSCNLIFCEYCIKSIIGVDRQLPTFSSTSRSHKYPYFDNPSTRLRHFSPKDSRCRRERFGYPSAGLRLRAEEQPKSSRTTPEAESKLTRRVPEEFPKGTRIGAKQLGALGHTHVCQKCTLFDKINSFCLAGAGFPNTTSRAARADNDYRMSLSITFLFRG
jgi:hypothetical protein